MPVVGDNSAAVQRSAKSLQTVQDVLDSTRQQVLTLPDRAAWEATMSMIYRCIDCDAHYCATCDGGQDSCLQCHTGPRCDECAAEHADEHEEEERICPDCNYRHSSHISCEDDAASDGRAQ